MNERHLLRGTSEILWGIVFILFGGVWLLHDLGVLDVSDMWSHWPLIIVAVGLLKLILAEDLRQRGAAVWWLFIGSWLYVSIHQMFGLGFGESWPLLIIAWGVSILWSAYRSHSRNSEPKES